MASSLRVEVVVQNAEAGLYMQAVSSLRDHLSRSHAPEGCMMRARSVTISSMRLVVDGWRSSP